MNARPTADPSPAIRAQKRAAAANDAAIASAIAKLQASGEPVTVRGVARLAKVHPDTVRRREDLYAEIVRLRASGPAVSLSARRSSDTDESMLRARILDAQSEIKELRAELEMTRKGRHQDLGTGHGAFDAREQREMALTNRELTAALDESRRALQEMRERHDEVVSELQAAHELNRQYVRELSAVTQAALDAKKGQAARRA